MISKEMMFIIAGMAIVTYIPRMLPLVFLQSKSLPPRLEGLLQNVPYAALGALIFPGVLFIHEHIVFGLIGTVIAFLISFAGGNLIMVVIGSIIALSFISPLFH